jgi:RNA polymerase sigma factor (sigma-70 family)
MVRDSEYLDLVEAAQAGRHKPMSQLAECVLLRLKPYFHRFVYDEDAAEVLLQEVLLAVVRFIGLLKQPESFWPWVYTVARNKIHQHHRDEARRKKFQCQDYENYRGLSYLQANPSPLQDLVQKERRQAVYAAVGQLNSLHRNVVELRCFEQMSFFEIAVLAGCNSQQARMRFYRAKRHLRDMLAIASVETE